MESTTKLTIQEVKKRMDGGDPLAFLDARNPKAWAEAKTTLPGAMRMPADEVAAHLSAIPRDRTVITYCT